MMNDIILPIIGGGSQPTESDGAMLDFMPLPEAMSVYTPPEIPDDLAEKPLQRAKALLAELERILAGYIPEAQAQILDLANLNSDEKDFVNQLLGEGEVAAVYRGDSSAQIQEATLAGVWRVQHMDASGNICRDLIEVADIPALLKLHAFDGAAASVKELTDEAREGIMNAPSLLTELRAQSAAYQPGAATHSINLTLLPHSEQDLELLEQTLGRGNAEILSRGYGNCRISATGTQWIWRVRYYNSQDVLILDMLEICDVPAAARAAPEDIADSRERLQELLQRF